jgi:hypothetical protein
MAADEVEPPKDPPEMPAGPVREVDMVQRRQHHGRARHHSGQPPDKVRESQVSVKHVRAVPAQHPNQPEDTVAPHARGRSLQTLHGHAEALDGGTQIERRSERYHVRREARRIEVLHGGEKEPLGAPQSEGVDEMHDANRPGRPHGHGVGGHESWLRRARGARPSSPDDETRFGCRR